MRAAYPRVVSAPSVGEWTGDERARDDGRRLPHLHVEREAPDLARGAPGRGVHPRDPTARGWRSSTARRSGSTAPTATWTPLAKTDADLTAVAAIGATVFAGTADRACAARRTGVGHGRSARRFRRGAGSRLLAPGGHAAPGALDDARPPTAARCSSTSTSVASRARSTAASPGEPTLAVDDDVHQVLAHPTRPEIVVAAASAGLCRSRDGGATWHSTTDGMEMTYARGVAIVGDDVLVIGVRWPAERRARPCTTLPSTVARWRRSPADCREYLSRQHRLPAASPATARRCALVDGDGDVWLSSRGMRRLRSGSPTSIAGVTGRGDRLIAAATPTTLSRSYRLTRCGAPDEPYRRDRRRRSARRRPPHVRVERRAAGRPAALVRGRAPRRSCSTRATPRSTPPAPRSRWCCTSSTPTPRGPYRRKNAPTFVVALAELDAPPADILRTGYPLLVRGLANLCVMVSPSGDRIDRPVRHPRAGHVRDRHR